MSRYYGDFDTICSFLMKNAPQYEENAEIAAQYEEYEEIKQEDRQNACPMSCHPKPNLDCFDSQFPSVLVKRCKRIDDRWRAETVVKIKRQLNQGASTR